MAVPLIPSAILTITALLRSSHIPTFFPIRYLLYGSSRTNASGNRLQALGDSLRRFAFTYENICPGKDGSLLTSVQLADKNNNHGGRTDPAKGIQRCIGYAAWK